MRSFANMQVYSHSCPPCWNSRRSLILDWYNFPWTSREKATARYRTHSTAYCHSWNAHDNYPLRVNHTSVDRVNGDLSPPRSSLGETIGNRELLRNRPRSASLRASLTHAGDTITSLTSRWLYGKHTGREHAHARFTAGSPAGSPPPPTRHGDDRGS